MGKFCGRSWNSEPRPKSNSEPNSKSGPEPKRKNRFEFKVFRVRVACASRRYSLQDIPRSSCHCRRWPVRPNRPCDPASGACVPVGWAGLYRSPMRAGVQDPANEDPKAKGDCRMSRRSDDLPGFLRQCHRNHPAAQRDRLECDPRQIYATSESRHSG